MTVTNVYTVRTDNVGDWWSSPLLYFSFPFRTAKAHILDRPASSVGNIIFGGGGLLHCRDEMMRYIDAAHGTLISWGIGHNTHGDTELDWPDFMSRFALHGIRDWGTPFPWVPCPSCMHPIFDCSHTVTRDVVIYDHKDYPTGVSGFPAATNAGSSMERVVTFLGTAETIVTNSYHGAYWGILLGRRVIVVNPFSTKFFHMRFRPQIADSSSWPDKASACSTYREALAHCRQANKDHFKRVCDVMQ